MINELKSVFFVCTCKQLTGSWLAHHLSTPHRTRNKGYCSFHPNSWVHHMGLHRPPLWISAEQHLQFSKEPPKHWQNKCWRDKRVKPPKQAIQTTNPVPSRLRDAHSWNPIKSQKKKHTAGALLRRQVPMPPEVWRATSQEHTTLKKHPKTRWFNSKNE
jgi:hypothetical protein